MPVHEGYRMQLWLRPSGATHIPPILLKPYSLSCREHETRPLLKLLSAPNTVTDWRLLKLTSICGCCPNWLLRPRQPWKPRIFQTLSRDRKSTRLNSSHVSISYAVFCLKKKSILSGSVPEE